MEATRLIKAIQELRSGMESPPTQMEIIRRAVERMSAPTQPAIFNDQQRKLFENKLDLMREFIESEDGADAVELLTNAFDEFVKNKECPVADESTVAEQPQADESEPAVEQAQELSSQES